jgi:hypothetical protein
MDAQGENAMIAQGDADYVVALPRVVTPIMIHSHRPNPPQAPGKPYRGRGGQGLRIPFPVLGDE